MALPDPYGSPPGRPARYVFYLTRHGDDDTQCQVVAFAEPYAARKFLDVLLEADGFVWDDPCTIRSETGVVVSTRWWPGVLRECVEHEYTLQELGWTLDDQHRKVARQHRYGPALPRTIADVAPRERRAAASTPRAPAPDGAVHIAEVAAELGLEPSRARAILRELKIPKPPCGWRWSPDEVEIIKTKIREAM